MPKAPQLEHGRAGTDLQVCGTPSAASAQPCMALGRLFLPLPWFPPSVGKVWSEV